MSATIEKWDEMRVLIEKIDLDVRKNAIKGNKSAGTRARKGLRELKKWASEVVKMSLADDKARKAASKTAKEE